MYRFVILLIFCFSLLGCQTAPLDKFPEVKKGMRKDQVIELVGGPKLSRRWKGRDRWTYIFFDDNVEEVKEVVFKEGKVIYVGDRVPPKTTAEQQDLANEQANSAVAAEELKIRKDLEADWQEYNTRKPQELPTFYRAK